jgi:hypothetical protein
MSANRISIPTWTSVDTVNLAQRVYSRLLKKPVGWDEALQIVESWGRLVDVLQETRP